MGFSPFLDLYAHKDTLICPCSQRGSVHEAISSVRPSEPDGEPEELLDRLSALGLKRRLEIYCCQTAKVCTLITIHDAGDRSVYKCVVFV